MKNAQKQRRLIERIVLLSLFVAISIVAGKYLAIRVGDLFRFSLENTSVLLAGILFGPIAGMAVGIVADLLGCVLVGYTINLYVTAGAAAIGLLAGLIFKYTKGSRALRLTLAVLVAHLVGSVIIKTIGLSHFYGMPLPVLMAWRALNYLIVGALDGIVLHLLLNISTIAKYTRPEKKETSNDDR